MTLITINGISLDPASESAVIRAASPDSGDAARSNHVLVQVSGPISGDERRELGERGARIEEYVSRDAYLCSFSGTDLDVLRELPFVVWSDVYLRVFKIAPALRGLPSPVRIETLAATAGPNASRRMREVDVLLHTDADPDSDDLRTRVAAAARLSVAALRTGRRKVRLVVQERYLDDVAALDEVRLIEEVGRAVLGNNVARSIIGANVVVNGTDYQGDGEVVAVADTGFDQGSTTAVHPAFTGRVVRLYALGRTGPDVTDDPDGHGTHVAGSVLGDGTSASMGGPIQGTAPRAQLVVQSLLDTAGGLGGIPADLHDLFEPPYDNDGARVHTNSWYRFNQGPSSPPSHVPLAYDQGAREIDDVVWTRQDLVICFCAGNQGVDIAPADGVVEPGQVGSVSAAKNCITVGASENARDLEITYGSITGWQSGQLFTMPPIDEDSICDDASGMAAFSSRGPTPEGRIKPDVVAPGTSILSTRSAVMATPSTVFGTSSDGDYFFDSGTSMATPLVAGCAAVLRETLVKNGMATPSAALVKALLINGAVELAGQYTPSEAGPSPNNNSGFGRVDLAGSVILPGPDPDSGLGEGGPLDQDESESFPVDIPERPPERPGSASGSSAGGAATGGAGGGVTFKVTLVWTDPEGPALQNDLDLIVVAADGSERHGNMGTAKGFDRQNNVEQVVWDHMPAGQATVTVTAFRITQFPQPYAYAWRIS